MVRRQRHLNISSRDISVSVVIVGGGKRFMSAAKRPGFEVHQ